MTANDRHGMEGIRSKSLGWVRVSAHRAGLPKRDRCPMLYCFALSILLAAVELSLAMPRELLERRSDDATVSLENLSPVVGIVTVICLILSCLAVSSRLIKRNASACTVDLDDMAIFFALVSVQ